MNVTFLPAYLTPADSSTPDGTTTRHVSPLRSLLELGKRESAIIDEIVTNARFGDNDDMISQRLNDLGFLPNTLIHIVAKGLFGRPPYAVQLSTGAQFSLRADELLKIRCRVIA